MTRDHLPRRKRLTHDVPTWVHSDSVFFVTVCARQRGTDQLCREHIAHGLLDSIRYREEIHHWWVHLAVVMPDHVHLLVSFAPEPGMERAISAWKRYTSRSLEIVWQDGFFESRLRTTPSMEEKGAYVQNNPVRAGLVARAEDWPYARVR